MIGDLRFTILLKCAALALLSAFSLQPLAVFAQGSLTPPGPPAPTMKSLAQIEPRTPISSVPFTISSPGSYYLSTNLTASSGNAITIATNDVALDLNGFTLFSADPGDTGDAVHINSGLHNLAIANGFIQGGVTNNGSGTYSGPGFSSGIGYSGTQPVNVRVSRVSVMNVLQIGIGIGSGDVMEVENCTVRTAGAEGIVGLIIKNCIVIDCGTYGIFGQEVSDSSSSITAPEGYAIFAGTANNCQGSASGVGGTGIHANIANNCYGYCSPYGVGVFAGTAHNCYGTADEGGGVEATVAQDCYGSCGGNGDGVSVTIAQNCYGSSGGSGHGVYAAAVAIGCYGSSNSGTGLSAFIGESCSGTSVNITHNLNSF